MQAFRFRAQAALEQRRREEDAAEAALVRAEAHFSAAREALAEAVARHGAGATAQDTAVRGGTPGHMVVWHRNWITGLAAAVEVRRREMNRHEAVVAEARTAWFVTRRKRLMLERLRERALARHRVVEQRWEAKQIDELARMRFMLAAIDRSPE
jgi:flagellar export protein FliJ